MIFLEAIDRMKTLKFLLNEYIIELRYRKKSEYEISTSKIKHIKVNFLSINISSLFHHDWSNAYISFDHDFFYTERYKFCFLSLPTRFEYHLNTCKVRTQLGEGTPTLM